jgi:ketol-acid reductoisomerase
VTKTAILTDSQIDASPLEHKQIGIIGYGSQGRAQVLNLRDSGFDPIVGVRKGKSFDRACADGLSPISVAAAAERSDILMVLVPDESQPELCRGEIIPHLRPGTFVGFAAGFTVHFGLVRVPPAFKAVLVAPKGPGEVLRRRFMDGTGIPALVAALEDDEGGLAIALAYAKAIGCGRVGVIRSSFREEAIADLFGEQCVLTGGLIELMKAAFGVLVARGYSPEVAYIECISEVEYMASLITRVGLANLGDHISSTAYYGGVTRGRRLIDSAAGRKLNEILDEIESGRFLEEFLRYASAGGRLEDASDMKELEKARDTLRGRS